MKLTISIIELEMRKRTNLICATCEVTESSCWARNCCYGEGCFRRNCETCYQTRGFNCPIHQTDVAIRGKKAVVTTYGSAHPGPPEEATGSGPPTRPPEAAEEAAEEAPTGPPEEATGSGPPTRPPEAAGIFNHHVLEKFSSSIVNSIIFDS